jgi:hypothetical protein
MYITRSVTCKALKYLTKTLSKCYTIPLGNLTVTVVGNESPAFYGDRGSTTFFTTSIHLSQTSARLIQFYTIVSAAYRVPNHLLYRL